MKETKGNILEQTADAICILSCGYIRLNGEAYIEKGQKAAAKKWPVYSKWLGHLTLMHGQHVIMLTRGKKKRLGSMKLPYHVVNFPYKPSGGISDVRNVAKQFRTTYKEGMPVPGWAMRTSMSLLKQSAKELRSLAKARGWRRVYIQAPTGIKWGVARPILDRILGDRFTVIFEEEVVKKKVNEEQPKEKKKIRVRRRR